MTVLSVYLTQSTEAAFITPLLSANLVVEL